ncbi:MAG: GntR family transcriptional regulator [Rhodospirillaceae bacterium]|nr:GntR family transcriptional regulator [Rhodospirillaceae bacterium]
MEQPRSEMLEARSTSPRYQELADILQREIENQTYPVSSRMPTELALCTRFGVSRFTVREAFRRLIDNGMVIRRQGSGTVVISKTPTTMFVQKLNSIEELLQYSKNTILKLQDTKSIQADSKLAAILGCALGETWQKIECIRHLDENSPICWTDVFVRPEYKALANQIGRDETPVFMVIEREFGTVADTITIDLFAGSIESNKAWALGVEAGSPTLVIVRSYRDKNGKVFEVSVSEHPTGRFTFSIDLLRSSKGG